MRTNTHTHTQPGICLLIPKFALWSCECYHSSVLNFTDHHLFSVCTSVSFLHGSRPSIYMVCLPLSWAFATYSLMGIFLTFYFFILHCIQYKTIPVLTHSSCPLLILKYNLINEQVYLFMMCFLWLDVLRKSRNWMLFTSIFLDLRSVQ